MRFFTLTLIVLIGLPQVKQAHAQSNWSEQAQLFISVCLQHAPQLLDREIRASASRDTYNASGTLAGASVAVHSGQSCNLRIGGAGTAIPAPVDSEIQRLAFWFSKRVGGKVSRVKSGIGGATWYKIRVGRKKYGVEGSVQRGGVVSYWVSLR